MLSPVADGQECMLTAAGYICKRRAVTVRPFIVVDF
jgi:hypothetical protein